VVEKLTNSQVQTLILNAIESFPHKECNTCECFLGYITQLEMDSDSSGRGYILQYQQNQEVHSCMGCDPCPPGDHFADYLRETRSKECEAGK
jgi:hypothetical protein